MRNEMGRVEADANANAKCKWIWIGAQITSKYYC